jgi:hypothetical protein
MSQLTSLLVIASVFGVVACYTGGPLSGDVSPPSFGDATVPPSADASMPSSSDASRVTTTLTYYHDIQPIIQGKCVECHNPTGIGPFAFQTPNDTISRAALISSDVSAHVMPPWPPADTCTGYLRDRSLTNDQVSTITTWVAGGAPEGTLADQVTASAPTGLSHVDLTLQMPAAFTPTESPDDYRCFLIPWTPTTPQYVTGFGITPGDPHIVHHAIAYIAPPDQVATYQALDTNEDGPGWSCFGGPGTSGTGVGSLPQWMGFWAPGSLGADFPTGTGILIQPGSQIVLQVHYNTANTAPAPDLTSIAVELEDTVPIPAALIPFADPSWLKGNMSILAGVANTTYNYTLDITGAAAKLSAGVLADHVPLHIYMAGLHMHTRGASAITRIVRSGGTQTDCMLDIPSWDFSWQGAYALSEPLTFNPGDSVYLQCNWNNTAANQPYVDGVQVAPMDLNWGETTEEEMCLGLLYVTQ